MGRVWGRGGGGKKEPGRRWGRWVGSPCGGDLVGGDFAGFAGRGLWSWNGGSVSGCDRVVVGVRRAIGVEGG